MKVTWLKRDLRTIDLFALGYSDVSSTYYFTLGVITLYSGFALPITMLLGSLALWIVGLAYAEFGSAIPRTGGAYYYVKRELGDFMGFLTGWLLSLDQILMISYGALGVIGYLSGFVRSLSTWPTISLLSIAIIVSLMVINILGIKPSARFNLALLIVDLLGILTLLFMGYALLLLRGFHGINVSTSIKDVMGGLAYSLRGYIGIDVIAQSTGEAVSPAISVPRAILSVSSLSTLVALALSLLVVSSNAVPVVSAGINDPIGALARYLIPNTVLDTYIAISIAIVLLIAVNAGIVDFSRTIYVMSEDGLIPRRLGVVHGRYRTPYIAIVTSSIIGALFTLPGSVELIAGSYGIASTIVYMLTMISLIRFDNRERELVHYFRTPTMTIKNVKVPIISLVGLMIYVTAIALVVVVRPIYLITVVAWALAGTIIYAINRSFRRS